MKNNILAHSAAYNGGRGTNPMRIVLRAHVDGAAFSEFYTHEQYLHEDGTTSFGNGHYFMVREEGYQAEYEKAVASFDKRVAALPGAGWRVAGPTVQERFEAAVFKG